MNRTIFMSGLLLSAAFLTTTIDAAMRSKTVEYLEGDTPMEGYVAYNDALRGPRPAILIVHDWMGVGPYVKRRADQLAALGYVAFAVDIYGKGVRPASVDEAKKTSSLYREDRALTRKRVEAGLRALESMPNVDKKRIVAIGYCFGGMVALELGRDGADVKGIVTFHGALSTPNPEDAKNIKGKVLALHGGDDPYVGPKDVLAFQDEMRKAGVDWQMVIYGGAVHAFTIKEAGNDPSKGAAYNEAADRRSWEEMKRFLHELNMD